MLYLGAKLHNMQTRRGRQYKTPATDAAIFLTVANRTLHWIDAAGLVDQKTGLIADYTNLTTCQGNHAVPTWTYQQGVLVGALSELAVATGRSPRLLSRAMKAVEAAMEHMTNAAGLLIEVCDRFVSPSRQACNPDQRMYKGIFVRHLRYLLDFLRQDPVHEATVTKYTAWLRQNADALLARSVCRPRSQEGGGQTCELVWSFGRSQHNHSIGPLYGSAWGGPYDQGAPAQQSAALDLFSALIDRGTSCIDRDRCGWNPPVPPLPLPAYVCSTSVCPRGGYACCQSANQGFPMCCNPGEECVSDGKGLPTGTCKPAKPETRNPPRAEPESSTRQ